MNPSDGGSPINDSTATFEVERQRLFGIAYRMLGSVADADDVVQDAWLRWSGVDQSDVANPAAFLTTVTSRLSLDRLKSAQRVRETYVGPWLPEPLTAVQVDDPESVALMQESVMLGFLAVLERLGPVERAVFVLREVFDLPYDSVASIVDRSEANCRQIARRARDHVHAERPRVAPNPERDRRLIDAFLVAVTSGDPDQLKQLLHDDVVLVSDGGAKVRAARHPILGVDRVARFLLGLSKNAAGEVTMEYVLANAQLGLYVRVDDDPGTLIVFEPDSGGGGIGRIFALRNPEKLIAVESHVSALGEGDL